MSTSVSFAKIVGSATETMWSQIYHAGDLFAVVSLTTVEDHPELNSMGKEIFNTLEADFFSLEEKKLTTIKEVIAGSVRSLPPEVTISASIAYSRDAILYLFLIGSGEILMRREDKIGVLLQQKQGPREHILASSGYLKHSDVLLLETGAFAKLYPESEVKEAMELPLPNAITEHLTEKTDTLPGNAAALALVYQGVTSPDAPTIASAMRREHQAAEPSAKEPGVAEPNEEQDDAKSLPQPETEPPLEEEDKVAPVKSDSPSEDNVTTNDSRFKVLPTLAFPSLSRRVLFGAIAVILIAFLVAAIFLTKQHSQSVETKTVYQQTLREAQEKFDEAEGLKNLNAALAQDDYKKARGIIKAGLPKVPKGSREEQELLTLLKKVEGKIAGTEGESVSAKAVDLSENPLLTLAAEKGTPFVTDDDGKYFALNSTAVFNEKNAAVIKNDDAWEKAGGIAGYNGNIYVLDKGGAVLKFAAGGDGYGKSSYFSGNAPSLLTASGIAIDGSVWLLFTDGSIKKYTKAKDDGFTISGLPSPMKNPTQIFTNTETDNVYILDRGNSRIVVLTKDGAFKKAYKATQLTTATVIDVQEKEQKIYILSGKNLFMIPLE
jgi:hypothetical protein